MYTLLVVCFVFHLDRVVKNGSDLGLVSYELIIEDHLGIVVVEAAYLSRKYHKIERYTYCI
jgi:hypothetical protein